MVTEIQSHATRLLEAMYDANRADIDQDKAIADYLEKAGLDPVQDGFDIVDFLADLGWVKTHHTMGTPRGFITPAGIHTIQELHARRADPKARAALLRTEMLRWLDGQEDDGVQPSSFQEFVDVLTEDSEKFSEREFRGTAESLYRYNLIEAAHIEESTEGWIHPRLTPEGRECLTDHGGDVAEYLRDRRGSSSTTHHSTSVHFDANNGNVAIGSENVTQNYNAGVNVEDVIKFADLVRETVPVLKLDQATQDDLAEIASELQTEATTPAPDRGRLRQLVDRLQAGVNAAAETAIKAVVLAAGEAAQKAITGG